MVLSSLRTIWLIDKSSIHYYLSIDLSNAFTIKQKAKEKRSRQSDVLSDMKNMDIMFGNFPEKDYEKHELECELEAELQSEELHRETGQVGENFMSLLNTNTSENSGYS